MRATQRLYLTWDRTRLVPEADPNGRVLFCKPGDEVPDSEARKYGLLPAEPEALRIEPVEEPGPKPPEKPSGIEFAPEVKRQSVTRKPSSGSAKK